MTRILILGGRGYVGARLLQRLAREPNLQGVGAGRRQPAANQSEFRVFDATNAQVLARELEGFDAIVNCVSGSPEAIADGARALREAVLTHAKPIRLIHMSSMAVYGGIQGDITESHPLDTAAQGYAGAKVKAEQHLSSLQDLVILRPGCIYGPDSPQWTTRMVRLLHAGRIGDLGVAGDGCSNLVYVDDVVEAIVAALALPAGPTRIYNLAMPDAPRWNEYFELLAREIRAVPVRRIGAKQLKLEAMVFAPLLRGVQKLAQLAGQANQNNDEWLPAIPPSLLRLWRQDIRLDSGAASRDLQLPWTPLATGVKQSVTPHRHNNPAH